MIWCLIISNKVNKIFNEQINFIKIGRRENHSSLVGNRAINLNPNNDYMGNFSDYSNEYGFSLNRYDKNY